MSAETAEDASHLAKLGMNRNADAGKVLVVTCYEKTIQGNIYLNCRQDRTEHTDIKPPK